MQSWLDVLFDTSEKTSYPGITARICREGVLTCALALALLTIPVTAGADIYKYVDQRGVVTFTDYPKHEGFTVHISENRSMAKMPYTNYYPYKNLVEEACQIYEMDDALVRAVMEVESDYNRFALSTAGARGLMQLMPETMDFLGVNNPWDARQNVQGGTRYLKKMLNRFSGDINLALAAYNAGASAVLKYGSIPPYPQTQRYVKKVMLLYLSYSGMTYR